MRENCSKSRRVFCFDDTWQFREPCFTYICLLVKFVHRPFVRLSFCPFLCLTICPSVYFSVVCKCLEMGNRVESDNHDDNYKKVQWSDRVTKLSNTLKRNCPKERVIKHLFLIIFLMSHVTIVIDFMKYSIWTKMGKHAQIRAS